MKKQRPQSAKGAKDRPVATNRKAYHDYIILDSVEAGIALTGTEIKSIREGKVNIRDAYARPENGELWLIGAHIAPYSSGGRYNHDPMRPRKLLLHRMQIFELGQRVRQKGLTLVPLSLYLKKGLAKIQLGVAKGKKLYDKRESMARRAAEREMDRSRKDTYSRR